MSSSLSLCDSHPWFLCPPFPVRLWALLKTQLLYEWNCFSLEYSAGSGCTESSLLREKHDESLCTDLPREDVRSRCSIEFLPRFCRQKCVRATRWLFWWQVSEVFADSFNEILANRSEMFMLAFPSSWVAAACTKLPERERRKNWHFKRRSYIACYTKNRDERNGTLSFKLLIGRDHISVLWSQTLFTWSLRCMMSL